MAGITGIGSGIDIDSIIKVMVDAEKAPKTNQLKNLETKTEAQFSALGTLRSAVNTFQTAIGNLNKASLYESRTASLSTSGYLTATASNTAPAGRYELAVQQLAVGSKIALKSFVEPVATEDQPNVTPNRFSAGTLTLSAGDPDDPKSKKLSIQIGEGNNTLAGIRDAINEQGESLGYSASLVTDASGTRLVISSSTMGDGRDVQVHVSNQGAVGTGEIDLSELAFTPSAVDPDDPSSGLLAPDSSAGGGAAGVITQARSAKLTVDGLQVVRDSNSIDGVIEGVTLQLTKADANQTINLTVGNNKSTVTSSLQQFVSAYNTLATTMGSLGAVVQLGEGVAPSVGALVGDSALRGLQSGLRAELGRFQQGDSIAALAQLGITTQKDGTLALDTAKLDKALAENFDGVASFLTGDKGLMNRLDKVVSGYTKTDGVFDQRQAGLRKTLNSIDSERKALDMRIEKMQTRLLAQYTAMDTLVAKLSSTSEWLGTQLSNLPGVVKQSKK